MEWLHLSVTPTSGEQLHRAIDEQIVAHKRAISQHFLGNGLSIRIARGPHDPPRWYVPLEGCNQLKDGEQPRANDVITRYPACTVQAVLGPCTRHGGPWASLALDADDEQGVDWVQRNLGGACTVWEKTPHGAHFYYIYRLQDAPNGEELPKRDGLNIDGAGTVDLRTRRVCCTLAGSVSQKDGSIYGPWMGQWAFRALNRDALFWLAGLAVRQKEAEVQPTMAATVAAPTTPHAVQVEGARTIDFAQYAAPTTQGASMDRRAEAALPSIVNRACAAVAAAAEGTRNSTLAAQAFQVARAYRDLGGAHSFPDDVAAALLAASDACGLPHAEAVACVQHAERDVFQHGKGATFSLQDRPYTRGQQYVPRLVFVGGAA